MLISKHKHSKNKVECISVLWNMVLQKPVADLERTANLSLNIARKRWNSFLTSCSEVQMV